MKKLTSFILFIILTIQIGASAYAFTDTVADPFTNKKYTHDDKFSNSEIINGIDVSQWQTTADFKKAKADGADFVFLRAACRGSSKGTLVKDTTFDKYAEAATKAGLDVGAYIYSQAITVAEAKEEADYIMGIVKNYNITLPIVLDFEYDSSPTSRLRAAKLTNRKRTDICLAFCERVEQSGYTAMVYANQSMLTDDLYDEEIAEKYDIWLANYSTSPKYGGKLYDCDYSYWQYSSTGKIDGISGNIDCNFRYFTAPAQVKNLKVTNEKIDKTTISWNRIKGCYGYQIYKINRSTGVFEKIATLKGASSTSYTDYSSMGLPNTYRVRAITAYKGKFSGGKYSSSIDSDGVFMLNLSSMGAGYATFNWQVYPGASEYRVLRASAENGQYIEIANVDAGTTHYTDYTEYGFKTYYYMVRAILKDDKGEIIANQYTPVMEIIKPQPSVSSVSLKSSNSIEIKWTNVSSITGTEIYRSANSGAYKKIATVSSTKSSYVDKGLKKGVKYTYKIRNFIKSNGKAYFSKYSNAKSTITLKAPVIKLTSGVKSAKITYAKVYGASGYEIYMKAPNGKFKLIKATSSSSYTYKKLTSKKTYQFKVRAYRKVNGKKVYSSFSSTKSIKSK